jgi:glutaryl-CoA dehydrogenase
MNQNSYNLPDYYLIDELLSQEHKIIRQSVRDWVNKEIKPHIEKWNLEHHFPEHIMRELGNLGILGPFIPEEFGGAGLDQVSYGLIMTELERGDSSIRSAASVQSSLVMYPIYRFGSEEQKRNYLPGLAAGRLIGCFGLTEPNHGSDPGSMETRLTRKNGNYLLNGAKMWITNSCIADLCVVWAKDDEGIIRGVLVEKGMKGLTAPVIKDKWSLRASITGELVFDQVEISPTLTPTRTGRSPTR